MSRRYDAGVSARSASFQSFSPSGGRIASNRTPASVANACQASGVAAAGRVSVGRGDQHAGRVARQRPAEAGCSATTVSGPMPPAVAAYSVSSRELLDRRQAQRVDRRLAHRDAGAGDLGRRAGGTASCRRPPRNCGNRTRASRSRSARPAASRCANQALPCGPSRMASAARAAARMLLRQSPLFGEVAPGRRSARQRRLPLPAQGDGEAGRPCPPRADGLRKRRARRPRNRAARGAPRGN